MPRRKLIVGCLWLLGGMTLGHAQAQPTPALPATLSEPAPAGESMPGFFTRATAMDWALRNNPELAALRQQHGIAAAAVIIAKTYPFNPVWTNKLFAVSGPEGITNRVAMEQRISIDLELRRQGRYRRQAAYAGLSRADWDIVHQESLLAMRVVRAFDNVLYQHAKLRLAEESLRLQRDWVDQVRKLVEAGVQRSPDNLLVAQTELDTFTIALQAARSALARAESELRGALGLTNEAIKVDGTLFPTVIEDDPQVLVPKALDRRPDLRARQAALLEAEERLRLAVADRFGNVNIGPDYEYNETSDNFLGAQLTVPLPVLNTHRGDILQREVERNRAGLDLRSAEVAIQQQVHAGLSRLNMAREMVETYRSRVLPHLEQSLTNVERLFSQAGIDLLKVIDVRRKLLQARGGHVDALYELRQARSDLAAAIADPALTLDLEPTQSAP